MFGHLAGAGSSGHLEATLLPCGSTEVGLHWVPVRPRHTMERTLYVIRKVLSLSLSSKHLRNPLNACILDANICTVSEFIRIRGYQRKVITD